ncbi:hypothetical protein KI387_030329, partial [Taxus chinensis]
LDPRKAACPPRKDQIVERDEGGAISWIDLAFTIAGGAEDGGTNHFQTPVGDALVHMPENGPLKPLLKGSSCGGLEQGTFPVIPPLARENKCGSSFKDILKGKESSMKPADITPCITFGKD